VKIQRYVTIVVNRNCYKRVREDKISWNKHELLYEKKLIKGNISYTQNIEIKAKEILNFPE
jgi:hypothetical protein